MRPVVTMTGLTVSVLHAPDGHRVLERRRGASADAWPSPPPPAAPEPLGSLAGHWPEPDHVVFALGPDDLGVRPFGAGAPPAPAQLRALAAGLERLHAREAVATRELPDAVRRLVAWVDGRPPVADPSAALALHATVLRRWGAARLARTMQVIDHWHEDAPAVALHGFASLGNAVGAPDGDDATWLLSGHDRTGPAEHDHGVLLSDAFELGLGHLVELPSHLDDAAVLGWARLRLLSHVVDHACFVGPATDLTRYLDLLADVEDDPAVLRTRQGGVSA